MDDLDLTAGRSRGAERFYIDVDVSGGWPRKEKKPLCKFGITTKSSAVRCRENQEDLSYKWDIEADLRVCFIATGIITGLEGKVRDRTSPWAPEAFETSSEWRRCRPRQLARIAVLLTEGALSEYAREAFPRYGSPEETFQIWREPVPSSPARGRSLWEPRPTRRPEGLEEYLFGDEDVLGATMQSHASLRRRNLYAERRSRKDSVATSSAEEEAAEEEASEESSPEENSLGDRGGQISFCLSPAMATLLEEAVGQSDYDQKSAYLRATASGRDRRAPIAAKAGIFLHWTFDHLGEEVGEKEWQGLAELTDLLFEDASLEGALQLARRHLIGSHDPALEQGSSSGKDPSSPKGTRPPLLRRAHQLEEKIRAEPAGTGMKDPNCSFRIRKQRKQLLEENAKHAGFASTSEYIRQVMLGQDREETVRVQCGTTLLWIEHYRGQPVGPQEWDHLERLVREQFGFFLFGASGESDPSGILERAEEHLLGMGRQAAGEEIEAARGENRWPRGLSKAAEYPHPQGPLPESESNGGGFKSGVSEQTGPDRKDLGGERSEKKEPRTVSLRHGDLEEVRRIADSSMRFNSWTHVLRAHLEQSLLGRIREGRYSPRKLAVEVGQASRHRPRQSHWKEERERIMVGLDRWSDVEEAARLADADLRRLERIIVRRGSLFCFPYFRCRPQAIVQAAARELAERTRGKAHEILSEEVIYDASSLRGQGAPNG